MTKSSSTGSITLGDGQNYLRQPTPAHRRPADRRQQASSENYEVMNYVMKPMK